LQLPKTLSLPLPNIQTLTLPNLNIGPRIFSNPLGPPFAHFPNLSTLDLSGNLIESLNDSTFAANPNLKEVNLSNNRVTCVQFLKCFKTLKKLEILDLSKNCMIGLKKFSEVENLEVSENTGVSGKFSEIKTRSPGILLSTYLQGSSASLREIHLVQEGSSVCELYSCLGFESTLDVRKIDIGLCSIFLIDWLRSQFDPSKKWVSRSQARVIEDLYFGVSKSVLQAGKGHDWLWESKVGQWVDVDIGQLRVEVGTGQGQGGQLAIVPGCQELWPADQELALQRTIPKSLGQDGDRFGSACYKIVMENYSEIGVSLQKPEFTGGVRGVGVGTMREK
jgi:hypothetical protein